ncbi:MAG: hypothetical protein H7123_03530 [Thermoleophilia bacterium]|nr:hypothetical protein [Thermoleophilia bacterium]
MDDASYFDEQFAAGPHDPFASSDASLPGVVAVLEARDAARRADHGAALASLARARAGGIPVELLPHARIIEGTALTLTGDYPAAVLLLTDTWRDHPDIAMLPAALGAAQFASGDTKGSARSLFAALASEDPDGSLVVHRPLLTQLLRVMSR